MFYFKHPSLIPFNMKTSITLALIGALIISTGAITYLLNPETENGVTVGNTAINIKFTAIDNSTFNLENQRGKVIIVDFITTSCPYCVEEFEVLKQLEFDERVGIVSVNLDGTNSTDLQTFADYYGLTWTVGSSQQAGIDYKVSSVPTLLIIDKDGVIRYRGYYTSLDQLNQVINRHV
jgi:thiol-disulfide isomerase/thioredoxin